MLSKSTIHGMGIFAVCNIVGGIDLGISHVKLTGFPHDWCRTPLGAFYNHSDSPNCELRETYDRIKLKWVKNLFTIGDISKGDEITCKYTLYSIE